MCKIPIRRINEPVFSDSFSIRDIQTLLAGKDMIQELHRHDFFYILSLGKGAGSHTIDFLPYTIGDNSIFFLRPGQVHRLELKAESTGYLMQFSQDFYFPHDNASRQFFRKAGKINHYPLNDKLLNILTYIFQEYKDNQEGCRDIIKANMSIFFIGLVRQHIGSPSLQISPYAQERLEEFTELLEKHAFHHHSVSEYAAMMNLSIYQLNAITRETMGKTCSQLINDQIILEAKRSLLATADQINQIADYLGYEDISYFIRFFKKHTGHSPEAFRNNFK